MEKQNTVVTFSASPEQRALLLEGLGNATSLTFLSEVAPEQREGVLADDTLLLSLNTPREIRPQDYPRLKRRPGGSSIPGWFPTS